MRATTKTWRGRAGILLLASVALASCAHLLGLRDPPASQNFPHRAHVTEGIPCVRCHQGIEGAGDDGPLHLPKTDSCVECHETPHNPEPCMRCHSSPFVAQDKAQAREHLRFSHEEHLRKLPGGCVRCHSDVAQNDVRLSARMPTCLGCHEHQDDFQSRDCSRCHQDLPAEVRPPEDHIVHDPGFRETHGVAAASAMDLCQTCHRERFCADCHGATAPLLPWRLAPADPLAPSVHRAGFRSRHGQVARIESGTCTSCHSPDSCARCHDDRGLGASKTSRSPHPPGWVGVGTPNRHGRAARIDPLSCASCHGGAGEALCVSCHKVGGIGGSVHPPGWSSNLSLSELPCRLCHLP